MTTTSIIDDAPIAPTRTIAISAFAIDVRCLNHFRAHRSAWIAQEYGITGPIEGPLASKPAVPGIRLLPFNLTLSVAGYAKLLSATRRNRLAAELRLTEGEHFGLILAEWRSLHSPPFEGKEPLDPEVHALRFTLYKQRLATAAGDEREAERLLAVYRAIKAQHDTERAERAKSRRWIKRALHV